MNHDAAPRGIVRGGLTVHAALVFAFLYAPILLLVVYSFSNSRTVGRWGGFTLDWYREVADNQPVQSALSMSLRVAAVSTLVAVVFGTLAALALERFRFRGRALFDGLLYLPIIIPDVTMAAMLLLFFTKSLAALDQVFGLDLAKGFSTVVISHIAFNISFVSVVVRTRLAGMDPRLEQAATDLYASGWQAFRYVTLPQLGPGIAGGALLALTLSLDDVVITQFVTGPGADTLPVYVFGLIRRGVTPAINAVSVIMLAASIVLVLASLATQRRRIGRSTLRAVAAPSAIQHIGGTKNQEG